MSGAAFGPGLKISPWTETCDAFFQSETRCFQISQALCGPSPFCLLNLKAGVFHSF